MTRRDGSGLREYARTDLGQQAPDRAASGAPSGSIRKDRAGIDVRARPHRDGVVLTVTLFNRQRPGAGPERAQERIAKSLSEARVECVVETGELVEYPRVVPGLLTEEEQEPELQYRTGASMAPRWTGMRTRSNLESPREYEKNIRRLINLTVNTPWVCIFPDAAAGFGTSFELPG